MKIVYTDELNNYSGVTNVYNLEKIKDLYYILGDVWDVDAPRYAISYVEEMLKQGMWTELKLYIEEE